MAMEIGEGSWSFGVGWQFNEVMENLAVECRFRREGRKGRSLIEWLTGVGFSQFWWSNRKF